jgi:hypothetical protein
MNFVHRNCFRREANNTAETDGFVDCRKAEALAVTKSITDSAEDCAASRCMFGGPFRCR